ncbi:MAG: hypothetical protein EBT05_03420 [Betaproteobacteria bacterium]|nr:hypothetical protein [Betaproteobacteria bacterium]
MLLGFVSASLACPICAPADAGATLRQRLRAADVVVLAAPAAGNTFVAQQLIKGGGPQSPIRLPQGVPELAQVSSLVLLYRNGTADWQSAGPLAPQHADWVRRLVELTDATDLTPAQWTSRIASFLPELESLEPLVAQAAYEETASAPYAVLRSVAPRLNAARLLRWLDTPALTARRPLYALLLGFAGSQASAESLQQRMAGLRSTGDGPTLSAMIAAWLELRGPEGVAWVERQYLSGPSAHEMGVSAALLALSVHGGDGQRVGRSRVVQAYRHFAAQATPWPGLVASDLGNWERWEFGPLFADWLASGKPQAFASRYAMVFFLMRSPRPEASTALESLRAAGAL